MRKTNKEMLLEYVASLDDMKCKEVYYLISDLEERPIDYVDLGFGVKLTQRQLSKLMWMWGKDKLNKCKDILADWIKKKGITKQIPCYYHLTHWVEDVYNQRYGIYEKKTGYKQQIDTAEKARNYVRSIPAELRAFDRDVKWLVHRYGTKILN